MLKTLNHKNIVKILNCYAFKNLECVFIMEYLQGGELFDYVTERGKLTEIEAKEIF